MPLTDIEREIAKAVANTYYMQRETTTHEQLLRVFGDPRPISMLRDRYRIIAAQGNNYQAYLPTLLAFEYCGDAALRNHARSAVEKVVTEAKTLFRREYKSDKQYPAAALLSSSHNLPSPISGMAANEIALGLFLIKEIPGIIHGQPNEKNIEITSFRISDYILTVDPTKVWDEYVRTNNPIDPPHVTIETPVMPTQRRATPRERQGQQAITRKPKATMRWPPARWAIVESLGEGGQGWTFKAHRKGDSNKKLFVLKRLKNKNRLARFEREIAALTKLEHPGILKIIETSQRGEVPYFVAEYCEGRDLGGADLSKRSLLTKLQLFHEVCDAVAAAHSTGILHRDLKPQNIFMRKDGSIAVGDFGLCIDLNDMKERATHTLEGVGAQNYIAPEVAKGRVEEPQPTTDVYSLGKVLYFMLTGRTLLREEYNEGGDDLRTPNVNPNVHFVYEIFDKTITARPEARFQTAANMLTALDGVIERVQSRAHVLSTSVRQPCVFCTVGEYRGQKTTVNEFMYVCSNCGNIQRFMVSHQKGWWDQ
jgi:serine/threonine protein kinase